MGNLLRVDFARVLKDKLVLVMCILAGVFSLITPVISGAMYKVVGSEGAAGLEMLGIGTTGAGQFFGALIFGSNLGLIAPILLGIILYKDFSSGTVRNKIISGYTRLQIFLSMYLVCVAVLLGVMLVHGLLSCAVGMIFFPFKHSEQTVGYLLASLGLELLVHLLVAAIVCWLCATKKNMGLVIVLFVAITMGLSLVSGILTGIEVALTSLGGHDTALKVIDAIQAINICDISMQIGVGTEYETGALLRYILIPLAETGLLLGWSALGFRKRDLK